MYQFSLPTTVKSVSTFREFAEDIQSRESDLILTNKFIYEPFI